MMPPRGNVGQRAATELRDPVLLRARFARKRVERLLGLIFVILFAAVIARAYHNRFWAATDDGIYAHLAMRVTQGEVLHRDVQDIHPGYINLVNAAAVSLFGPRFVSMRYPLAALIVMQAVLIYVIVLRVGVPAALAASLGSVALGVIQYLNPTANWYAVTLTVALAAVLDRLPRSALRAAVAGILWSVITLFRQLSGVFVALGVLVAVLTEQRMKPGGSTWRVLLLVLAAAGLLGYLVRSTDFMGGFLFGAAPMAVLAASVLGDRRRGLPSPVESGAFATGVLLGAAPLVVYLTANSAWRAWFTDVFVTAVGFPSLEFFERPGYTYLILGSLHALQTGEVVAALNGLLWLSLLGSPLVLGFLLIRYRLRFGRWPGSSLPVLALFLGLTAVHYQLPIYLFYAAGPLLAGILILAGRARIPVIMWTVVISMIAFRYQAGQPLERTWGGVLRGVRMEQESTADLPWLEGLKIPAADARRHERIAAIVRAHAAPGDAILIVPDRAEIYVTADRRNAAPYWSTTLGLATPERLRAGLAALEREPPALIALTPGADYWTPAADSILAFTRSNYRFVATFDGLDFYVRSGEARR